MSVDVVIPVPPNGYAWQDFDVELFPDQFSIITTGKQRLQGFDAESAQLLIGKERWSARQKSQRWKPSHDVNGNLQFILLYSERLSGLSVREQCTWSLKTGRSMTTDTIRLAGTTAGPRSSEHGRFQTIADSR